MKAPISASALLLLVVLESRRCQETDGYFNDSPYESVPEIKYVRLQTDSTHFLKCNHDQHHHFNKNEITWERKKCETNSNGLTCDTNDLHIVHPKNNNWEKLYCKKSKLEIKDANSEDHSGLYRCLRKGSVKRAYVVEVVESGKYTGPKPEVVSIRTSNITSQANIEFVIRCNVTSVNLPKIIWFKKCYGPKCDVIYEDVCYCHLNLPSPVYNAGNMYLSKINIVDAKEVDSGVYVCLAVTAYGRDYKNVTISVPKPEADASFSMLFMIPFGLILAPVVVWLCYYRGKRKSKPEVVTVEHQKHLI